MDRETFNKWTICVNLEHLEEMHDRLQEENPNSVLPEFPRNGMLNRYYEKWNLKVSSTVGYCAVRVRRTVRGSWLNWSHTSSCSLVLCVHLEWCPWITSSRMGRTRTTSQMGSNSHISGAEMMYTHTSRRGSAYMHHSGGRAMSFNYEGDRISTSLRRSSSSTLIHNRSSSYSKNTQIPRGSTQLYCKYCI
jgi:hypothetical protein